MSGSTSLYDADFFAWTEAQAAALRRREAGANALDYGLLAEEIEGLGREQLRACVSLRTQILAHFLKREHNAHDAPAAGWRREIVQFRRELEDRLTRSLAAKVKALLPWCSAKAVRRAAVAFAADEPETTPEFPDVCAYSWDDILGRGAEWTPARP